MNVFSEIWADEKWHKYMMDLNPLVDNVRFRLRARTTREIYIYEENVIDSRGKER
jgi:hypothetical protein